MPDFGLKVAVADTVKDLLGDTLEHRKATSAAITPDGRVSPAAVAGALPWQAHDGKLEGSVSTGSNRLRWHFPQGGVIRQVSYDVRTAPSGGALQFTLSGGSSTESFGLQAGQTNAVTNTNIRMAAGSWARLNVTAANGAADLAVTLQYESAGTGSTVSGGGGGGGGGTISVISVNGQTGVVELNADDIDDTTTTHKFMSAAEKAKLASFEPGDYVLASSLALVATSGDYDDLDNKPTLGTAAAMDSGDFATDTQGAKADTAVQPGDLADVATSGDYDDLDNTPTIPAQFNPIAGANMSITGTYPDITFNASGGGGGGGDMFASTYDPTGKAADAFDMANMDESASAKIFTSAERTKLANIEAGAEVNVQSDWDATSGDAAILNKPTEFPPEPHDHDTRYYTQAEVDALIAAVQPIPPKGATSSALSITVSGATDAVISDAEVEFTGLDPDRTYDIKIDVGLRVGSSGRFWLGTRAVGATTVQSPGIGNQISAPESPFDVSAVLSLKPDASGSIKAYPRYVWISGSFTIVRAWCVATIY